MKKKRRKKGKCGREDTREELVKRTERKMNEN